MESEGAAFDRVVENARVGLALKGETRRRRVSIGVDGALRIKARESETRPKSLVQNLFQIVSVFRSSLATM